MWKLSIIFDQFRKNSIWKMKNRSNNKKSRGGKMKDQVQTEIRDVTKKYEEFDPKSAKTFDDFPLSRMTLNGLSDAGFQEPTDIQRESIGLALRGLDVLGAAMTGSGKTLAFLIPVLEMLWRNRWTRFDGLGALIISPTRELAMQIYDVLRKIGAEHDFSAALIVGGTDVSYEARRLGNKSIIVCTPGRLLQHMDENPNFDCGSMKMLVIDEADRLLDMGFEGQLNAIISNLPKDERQTLLFSATQTRSVKDLARLSLKDPVYVSVHEHAKYSTPERLRQSYAVCEEHDKFSMLWSFIKNHQFSKVLVFMSNCKQVRFANDAITKLRPHTTILCLHGSMPQMKRVNVYQQFCNKQHVVLLATDIAARGLDFPAVDWVLQLDCPSDANEYIHRCGRTARYQRDGEALLVLTPSQESAMIEDLKAKKIPISKITINPDKLVGVRKKLEAFCTQDGKLKESAQRAFVAYIRSIFLMSNKKVFDVSQINYEAMARSYGLAVTPRIRFLRKRARGDETSTAYSKPSNSVNAAAPDAEDNDDDDSRSSPKQEDEKPVLEVATRRNRGEFSGWAAEENDDQDDEGLFMVTKHDVFGVTTMPDGKEEVEEEEPEVVEEPKPPTSNRRGKPLTRAAVAKKLLKKKIVANKKVTFDEEGNMAMGSNVRLAKLEVSQEDEGYNIDTAKKLMEAEDEIDRRNYRKRIREKHQEEKRKRKLADMEKRTQGQKGARTAVLGGADESGDEIEYQLGSDFEGDQGGADEDPREQSYESEEEEEYKPRKKKQKRTKSKAPADEDDLETPQLQQDYTDLNLEDAEQLALRLIDG